VRHLRADGRHSKLFDVFTSKEALRWTRFVRNIDARGWERHLRGLYSSGNKNKYLSHSDSSNQAWEAGELEIVKAMVERTPMDVEARSLSGLTPLHWAARWGHIHVVQYLCDQGADKQARNVMCMI